MADDTTLNPGFGGDVIATDDIGGIKYQRVKFVIGGDGVNDGDVAAGNPLPVTVVNTLYMAPVTVANSLYTTVLNSLFVTVLNPVNTVTVANSLFATILNTLNVTVLNPVNTVTVANSLYVTVLNSIFSVRPGTDFQTGQVAAILTQTQVPVSTLSKTTGLSLANLHSFTNVFFGKTGLTSATGDVIFPLSREFFSHDGSKPIFVLSGTTADSLPAYVCYKWVGET